MSDGYDAVLFDMDGVTVRSAAIWRQIELERILPDVTDGEVDPATVRALSIGDMYTALEADDDVTVTVGPAEFYRRFDVWADEVYREHATLLPGYRDLVTDITERGAAVGLVSASRREWVEIVLERFDLEDSYDAVVTASDIDGPTKPDPEIYHEAATELAVPPHRCLVVEDSAHGIEAATTAGMYCIALRGDGNETTDLTTADEIVEDHHALRRSIHDHLQSRTVH